MDRLKNKTALVTGAAGGIGLATARRFAEEGACVVLSDVNVDAGESAAQGLGERFPNIGFVELDASREEDWAAALRFVKQRFGSLDILVNNAFSGIGTSIGTATLEQFRSQFKVTTDGTFLGMHLAQEYLSEGGAIVNLSSIAAIVAAPYNAAYGAAKAAVSSMTKSAAMEYARQTKHIRVNAVAPGLVRTAALEAVVKVYFRTEEPEGVEKGLTTMAKSVPMARLGDPVEIANAILFLASDEASFITGEVLVVDGGQSTE